MHHDNYKELQELNWRRRLTPAELAQARKLLAAQPRDAEEWERENALTRLLEQLPTAPVSSNFTARVLAGVRAGEGAPTAVARPALPWLYRSWWARLAGAAVMVGVGFFSFQEYASLHRTQAAQEVAAASQLAALPPIEWLNDFDTIQRLDKVKVADDDLLSVLE
jgi:anti-sigma factor RsiW